MDAIEVDGYRIGSNTRPYIIAEAGTNFRDDIELAERLIEEAAAAGADAVKFQTHRQRAEMAESAMREFGLGDLYERLGRYELSVDQHKHLQSYCQENDVTFLSTPYSVEGLKILVDLDVSAIKIGSGELTNYPLLDRAAATGKPLLVSTGMADMTTIEDALEFLTDRTDSVALFYCVSEYPVDPSDFEFGVIESMSEEYGVPVGLSDHSTGVEAPAVAMAQGAALVEKHFTIDRRLPGGDQEASIEPEELKALVQYADLVHETRGDAKNVTAAERDVAEWAHHSVVTAEPIAAGEELTADNTTTKRPGIGIPAAEYYEVLGKELSESLPTDAVVKETHLSD